MKKLLPGSDKTALQVRETLLPDRTQSAVPNRRLARQQTEELKRQVLDLAERHMEVSMRILKSWIAESPK